MACRLDRCGTLRRPTAISTQQAASFGTQTPAAGFAPPTRHARPLIFSPHATYRRLISSYKFLLSPPLFPVAAPHRPSAPRGRPSSSGHRGGLLLIPFRSTAARLQRAFFFIFRFCPFSPLRPPPFRHRPRGVAPSAARRPFPHDLRRAVPGIPTVRRFVRIHSPPSSPHRPCPKIIVLRSASL